MKIFQISRFSTNITILRPRYLCPQCGFVSCEIGSMLTEEEHLAKLVLVREIAETVWGC